MGLAARGLPSARRLPPARGLAAGAMTAQVRDEPRGRSPLESVGERDQRWLAPRRAEERKADRKASNISPHNAHRGVPGHSGWP